VHPNTVRTARGSYLAAAGLLAFAGGLALLFFFAPDRYPIYPRCLLYTLTGLQCPGCGALRAMHRLLHGEFAAAFRLNPLLILLIPFFAWLGIASAITYLTHKDCLHLFRRPFWLWLLLAAVIVFGVGRNLVRL